MKRSWRSWLPHNMKCWSSSPSDSTATAAKAKATISKIDGNDIVNKRELGGWKCMPYILGNETFEKVASFGLTANFTLYLVGRYHMEQVAAAQVTNIFSGTTNFAPLLGAFISDAYIGRFRTLAYTSVASFLGMIVLMLTAMLPQLQPPTCTLEALQSNHCQGPTKGQISVLILSLILLTIGAAGIRPCSLPFGVDQFDRNTERGRRGLISFFNWYYFTSTAATVIAFTVVVYIQDTISWPIGFGIPAGLMLLALVMFFSGMKLYEYVPPEGSVFSGIVQVFVAAFHKRLLPKPVPSDVEEQEALLYNPVTRSERVTKLSLSSQFRFLNKAAITCEGELNEDGSIANPWRLCTIQQIEEVKLLFRIVPIWASGIVCFVALAQQFTFPVFQSLTMDRSLGPHFQIPAPTVGAISLIALTLFIPIYDQLFVPITRRITGLTSGITLLQRQGTGLVISALSMVVAGLVEQKRRNSALAHGGITPLSVMWLCPQLVLMGIAEAFNAVGQIEFYNRQFPEHMQTLAMALFFCSLGGSNYLSTILVSIIKRNTDWLDNNNINLGRVDYFYYVIAAMGAVNFVYFLVCAHFYRYKGTADDVKQIVVIENTREDS